MIRRAIAGLRAAAGLELAVVPVAVLALVGAQLMLSATMHGTNFAYGDGKMAQAVILAAQKFGGFFHFNNISPIQGLGSQMLPLNVWLNPAHWPFAILDKALASDISAAVALTMFAVAIYTMARCFDVPSLPSIVAAQSCILLFAPMVLFFQHFLVFSSLVGNAVVYAPHMVALGLLARLAPGSWRHFVLITASIFGLLLYSLCCDPLWSIISGLSWALPFAVVTLSPLRPKAVLIRCLALTCCLLLLIVSGAAEYLYTLTQYTARVQFSGLVDRVRQPDALASTLFHSRFSKYFYFVWFLGWVLGLLTLRGRPRVLVIAGLVTFAFFVLEIMVYLLLQNAPWTFPIPMYTEHSLFPLFVTSAAVGYWGALRAAIPWVQKRADDWLHGRTARSAPRRSVGAQAVSWVWLARAAAPFAVVAFVPAAAALIPAVWKSYASVHSPDFANRYNEPWANEPELVQLLSDNTATALGRPFRGASLFWHDDYPIGLSVSNLWTRGIPTISEYSQLVTPQSVYFNYAVLKNDVRDTINVFVPLAKSSAWEVFSKVMPLLGTRYYVIGDHSKRSPAELLSLANQSAFPRRTVPQGTHHNLGPAARWYVYEIPHTNLGDYSPTEVMIAETGAEAAVLMTRPDFDFTTQAVLSRALDTLLVPARNLQMSLIRGGLHVVGHSDGTSLVVLPQQFSHCLRSVDKRVRLVRANLMLTGLVFSGDVDTNIVFDYGVFTPRCRRIDLADIQRLDLHIDARAATLSGEHLFPEWWEIWAKLKAAAIALK